MTGPDAPPLLQVAGLAWGHHGRPLGQGLDLALRPGEIVALLGPNGCGKTTLLRSLLGLIEPLAGQVRVDGEPLHGAGLAADRARVARHIAYVPQSHAGVFAYPALELVLMGRAAHVGALAMPSVADREVARQSLQRMGVQALAQRPCTELSGGERQLVLIARALAQQAPLLVMDEPTASLDFGSQRRVLREIEALARQGVAVLLSTHQPEHALRIAHRVVLLARGGVQALGPAASTVTAPALAALYGVPAAEVARSVPGIGAELPAPAAVLQAQSQPEPDAALPATEPDDAGPTDAERYRAHMRRHRLLPRPASAWDARAARYGSGEETYVEEFLRRMDLEGAASVLDVGCGSGSLAIPLAQRLDEVVALDFSAAMLAQLQQRAQQARLSNIRSRHLAWEDDWSEVPVCDIAIASRSTLLADLDAAIAKLNRHARQRVYISYLSGGRFVDPELLALAALPVPPAPPLSWVLGMLLQRGLYPTLDYIETPSRLAGCRDFDEFAQRLAWSSGEFDASARARLRAWFDADPARAQAGGAPMRWAFIGWRVQHAACRGQDA